MTDIRLRPGEVSMLVLLSSVAWTAAGRKLVHSPLPDQPSLYSDLHGAARHIADTILAVHERDNCTLWQNRRYVRAAWGFIKDSVYRRDSLPPDEFAREVRKLRPIERLLSRYLTTT